MSQVGKGDSRKGAKKGDESDAGKEIESKVGSKSGSLDLNQASYQWSRIKSLFRSECGEASYQKWLSRSRVVAAQEESVTISVADKKSCMHVEKLYKMRLLKLWQSEDKQVQDLQFVPPLDVSEQGGAAVLPPQEVNAPAGVGLNPDMVFSKFVVGSSNELAFQAAMDIAKAGASYSPLYIHGSFGLGKTHLLHAIAAETSLKHLLLTADRFVKIYVKAIRERENLGFDGMFDDIELLLIDDVHMIAGKKSSEAELSNIVGRLRDRGCRIVVASSVSLSSIENLNPCLGSRLDGGLAAEILPMDNETAISFIGRKAGEWDMQIPSDVVDFIALNLPTDKRALEGILKALRARTQLLNRPITREIAEPILRGLGRGLSATNPTIRSIQDEVCNFFEVTMNDLKSPRRHKRIVVPRQVAMYLCKQLTSRSLPEIAAKFGGKDHTTVIHACKKIAREIDVDVQMRLSVDSLTKRLKP